MQAANSGRYSHADPPALLKQAWHVRRWGALPKHGGLEDQPAGMLDHMSVLLNVYDSVNGYFSSAGNSVGWAKRNPKAWAIVEQILEHWMTNNDN